MVQGMTIQRLFRVEGFSLDDAKQELSDRIREVAKAKNVALIGDMTFAPTQIINEQLYLMRVYSDTEPYEPDPEIEI